MLVNKVIHFVCHIRKNIFLPLIFRLITFKVKRRRKEQIDNFPFSRLCTAFVYSFTNPFKQYSNTDIKF